MYYTKKKSFVFYTILLFTNIILAQYQDATKVNKSITLKSKVTVLDIENYLEAKAKVSLPLYESAFDKILKMADSALLKDSFSVMDKTQIPPSGSKHDYMSIGPYWWSDPDKADGLPWIRKDGEVNPLTREASTDYETKSKTFHNIHNLAMGYFFSDKKEYGIKALDLLKVWFLNEDTKMNPNLNFAQAIPGKNTGRGIGIIEFAGITNIITAIEILELNNVMNLDTSKNLRQWFIDYLMWLQTSENGIFAKNTKNNHAVWYDVQIVSILMFLGREEEAKIILEDVKTKRIATQIEPDGTQPHELERTKALSYSTMNLKGFTQLAYFGKRLDIDLWNFESENGAGIKKAYEFLKPYANDKKKWNYNQISGLDKSLESLQSLFALAGSQFEINEYCSIGGKVKKDANLLIYNCN